MRLITIIVLFISVCCCIAIIQDLKKEQAMPKFILSTKDIDTSSFYWNSKDIRDISSLKNKYTSVVVADSFTYKAWSIDIQKFVAPFDTIDWCAMQILSYHKKD